MGGRVSTPFEKLTHNPVTHNRQTIDATTSSRVCF